MITSFVLWVKNKFGLSVFFTGVMIAWLILSIWIGKELIAAKIKSLKDENDLIKKGNLNFTDQNQNLIDQNDMLTEQKQELMGQVKQYETNHDLIVLQVGYIKKWTDPIGKLEEHIQHVIQYCKLKNKFYANPEEMDWLLQQITYDVDEGDDEIIVPLAIALILKFKQKSDKLIKVLQSMNYEEMKGHQDDTSTDKIEKMMDEFVNEVQLQKRTNAQKKAEAKAQVSDTILQRESGTQQSPNTAVQKSSWTDYAVGAAYMLLSLVKSWFIV